MLSTENNDKLKTIGIFVLVFLVGFIAGINAANIKEDLSNITIQTSDNKLLTEITPNTNLLKSGGLNCPIKGNIGSAGKKVFHVSGGQFYNTVIAEQCFIQESEALAAGYKKSSR